MYPSDVFGRSDQAIIVVLEVPEIDAFEPRGRPSRAGAKKYACASCAARFHTTSNLRSHERRAHRPPDQRYACARCERRFHDRTKLRRHLDAHDHVKRFKCDHCLARFSRRCHWKRHLERQHAVSVPPQRPGRRPTRLLLGEQPQPQPQPQ
ncbi:zinc finger protein 668-like [Vanessa cardui]|uniref:zinc finger protein 668-like n=1 Tax=Vanessa cardui TaxID=171605 RepID=UPI001F12FBCD|nr:zinc finger protein 668-like [Vanessa cardui]XP_046975189.1 zinc finger protein 668-like [Vanessa cardui]